MTSRRIVLIAVFLWCAAIYATPLLAAGGGIGASLAGFSYRFFSHICHQLDSHSFFFHGAKFPVCVRCTSIYTAFFFSLLVFPLLSRWFKQLCAERFIFSSRSLFLIAAVPMATDVVSAVAGVHSVTTMTRLLTGAWFGFIMGIVLAPLLEEALHHALTSFYKNHTGAYHETKA
ncbi:MAG: DUF2085 domain-containing protein [Bacteroidota bacterium]|nr:DUF2085 domain-containing protein [Bacteroidota bacterium]